MTSSEASTSLETYKETNKETNTETNKSTYLVDVLRGKQKLGELIDFRIGGCFIGQERLGKVLDCWVSARQDELYSYLSQPQRRAWARQLVKSHAFGTNAAVPRYTILSLSLSLSLSFSLSLFLSFSLSLSEISMQTSTRQAGEHKTA